MARKGRRQTLKDGYEYDLVYKAPLCIFDKPGIKKWIKKKLNRRERREYNAKIRKEIKED